MVLTTPRLWRFIVQPMLVALGAFVSIAALVFWLVVPWVSQRVESVAGSLLGWATFGLSTLVFVLSSGFLFLLLVSFFSSTMWEKLSLEVELIATGNRVESKLPISTIIADNVARGLLAVMLTAISLCCGWILFGIPAILMAGYLGLHDYTAAAYLRRGLTFGDQRERVFKLHGWVGFLLLAGVLTLLPVVNVLMLPCLVAGGTLMVAESDV